VGAFVPSPQKRLELVRAGLLDNPRLPFTWDGWDDAYNDIPSNGRDRTPAQIMLDWLMWMQDVDDKKRKFHIWLYGPTGRGKTHLAVAIAVIWSLAQDVTAMYSNWADRLGSIKESYSNGFSAGPLQDEINAGILVMDDIGTERCTHYNNEALYRVVNGRQGRPTIWTSNWCLGGFKGKILKSDRRDDDQEAVKVLGEKIGDRLSEGRGGYLAGVFRVDAEQSYRGLE
jgi:DNA replication protein DnaC